MNKKINKIGINGNYKTWTIINTGRTACKCEKCGHKIVNSDPYTAEDLMEKHMGECQK